VLLRLPVDLFVELARGHHRHGDLADDDALAIDADRDVALLDLGVVKDPGERLGDRGRIHDVTVDDRLRGELRPPPADDLELLARLFELHDLDRARADIDADEVLAFGHPASLPLSLANQCGTPQSAASKNDRGPSRLPGDLAALSLLRSFSPAASGISVA